MGCSPCRKLCSFIICRTWLALCFDFRIPEAKFLLFERKQFDLNYLNLHFLYQKFSLRNPKKFRTFEPFKLSNARFFYPYKQRKKFRTQPSFVRKRCKICNAKPWAFFSETEVMLSTDAKFPSKISPLVSKPGGHSVNIWVGGAAGTPKS